MQQQVVIRNTQLQKKIRLMETFWKFNNIIYEIKIIWCCVHKFNVHHLFPVYPAELRGCSL